MEKILKLAKEFEEMQNEKSDKKLAKKVFKHLKKDYPKKAIKWVKDVKWIGPVKVSINDIDFSDEKNWKAFHDKEHIQDFVNMLDNGEELKPVVLLKSPGNKLFICDGHHRSIGSKVFGEDILAYIAEVPQLEGPWKHLHSKQKDGELKVSRQKI